jgi:hypothetical protein
VCIKPSIRKKRKIIASTLGVAVEAPLFLFHREMDVLIQPLLLARKQIGLSLRQPSSMHSCLLEKVLIE